MSTSSSSTPATPVTYSSYLHLPELLTQQEVLSDPPEHDELLFIVIHQVYELWFKLILHELDAARPALRAGDQWTVAANFKRVRMILKTLVGQLDIIETMTPMSFTSFRDRLETSSGFQSTQFRELEFLLGYKRPEVIKYLREEDPGRAAVMRRLAEPSLIDDFHAFLAVTADVVIPDDVLNRDVATSNEPSEGIQDALHELYVTRPDYAVLFELMLDLDEGLQEWRYRHVKLVERTIGGKHGSGGSPGVEFLKKSLFRPTFADLWAIRHRL